eukprot:CAMPEP_0170257452 /NCGR_PEP_ID=MMETSP0116_2-20130129/28585_1 /TAXON_ID=400756 /ORGANISM="Durinskia baltica, Strain CSIRO CS-38" /LENGTH=153 /DNA_ID=CAMNT_0010508473 /DNA_START=56 /DNA_END=514 /DNA_ORIENTATION=+
MNKIERSIAHPSAPCDLQNFDKVDDNDCLLAKLASPSAAPVSALSIGTSGGEFPCAAGGGAPPAAWVTGTGSGERSSTTGAASAASAGAGCGERSSIAGTAGDSTTVGYGERATDGSVDPPAGAWAGAKYGACSSAGGEAVPPARTPALPAGD